MTMDKEKKQKHHQQQHRHNQQHEEQQQQMQEEEEMTKKKPKFGSLFRSILYWSTFVKETQKSVKTPKVTTYSLQIQQCQEMYNRLQLDRTSELSTKNPTTILPFLRSRTMITQSRPTTYKMRQKVHGGHGSGAMRPVSIRSAPAVSQHVQKLQDLQDARDNEEQEHTERADAVSQSSDCELDKDGHGRKRSKMDPDKLSEYLNERGLGLPSLVRSSQTYRRLSQMIPRGWKSRPLPKNPSSREKIKGRARLDQEMANMKALAFCEQQAPKVFRTASANMRNRDVQFMEEELRDHLYKEVDGDGDVLDFDDDNASIVMMPIKQEELFLRINTWIDDVESACKPHHKQGHPKDGNTREDIVVQSVDQE